jgi:energy-coupling factor transport system substrate-specific component
LTTVPSRRLGLLAAFTALAIVGRVAFLWAPNVALTYVVVFAAGAAYGARFGFSVGVLSMAAANLFVSGLDPVSFVNAPAMGLLGAAGGLLARFVDLADRSSRAFAAGLAAVTGVAATLLFSVVADTLSYVLYYAPSGAGHPSVWAALAAAGLVFNAIPAAVNAILFGAGLPPALDALRRAGLTGGAGAAGRPAPLRSCNSSSGRHSRLRPPGNDAIARAPRGKAQPSPSLASLP